MLLVLQGMDTSGKGGTVKHVVGHLDPGGIHVASFGKPTKEELAHDFLWRIRAQLPRAGKLGVFDRSHYEDVGHRPRPRLDRRRRRVDAPLAPINRFEEELVAAGTLLLKCFLHISRDEQRERLLARLDDPTKHWKYNPADLDDRGRVGRLHGRVRLRDRAHQHRDRALAPRAGRPQVVPQLGGHALLLEQLDALGLRWPDADFDVEAERARLEAMP